MTHRNSPLRPTSLTLAALALSLPIVFAGSALAGVLIGNPIVCEVVPAAGDSISSASGYLVEYVLDDCNGKRTSITVEDTVDFEAGLSWEVPSDDWCSMTLRFDGGLTVSGDNGQSYTETSDDDITLTRVTGTPDGFKNDDIDLSAAMVGVEALVE